MPQRWAPSFVELNAPTDDELHALFQTPNTRLMKVLTRRGVLVDETGQIQPAGPDAKWGFGGHTAATAGRGGALQRAPGTRS